MNVLRNRLAAFGLDWFLPAIVAIVCLAYFIPGPGLITQPISLAEIANYGVAGIFFFYGLKLNIQKLKLGLSNWRMHLVIQLTTFLLFPLLAVAVKPLFKTEESLWMGIFFLASLPSTVSSSVVMVSLAGGNIPAAIFNASISAFLGIFITPLWIGLFLHSGQGNFTSSGIVMKLTLQVLTPVIVGVLLNKRLEVFVEKHKKNLKIFDQVIILVIVYTSFCRSFAEKLFENLSGFHLILLTAGMLLLFLTILQASQLLSKGLNFNREDTITVMFCGSKKSLVHGSVMAGVLFTGSSLGGMILLPLMLYHALQLLASGILAKRIALSEAKPDHK